MKIVCTAAVSSVFLFAAAITSIPFYNLSAYVEKGQTVLSEPGKELLNPENEESWLERQLELMDVPEETAEEESESEENQLPEAEEKAEEEPAAQSEPSAPVYSHSIDVSGISPSFNYPYTAQFLQALRNGNQRLYYSGDETSASFSLGEAAYNYLDIPDVYYYAESDLTGTYLLITDADFQRIQNGVQTGDAHWNTYLNYVYSACSQLNLNTSDADLIDQINAYVCSHFSYLDLETESMYTFVTTGQGKCIHYAELMADMCNAVGIPAWTVSSTTHEWVNAQIDGTVYTFDPTYNDTSGLITAYSWQ